MRRGSAGGGTIVAVEFVRFLQSVTGGAPEANRAPRQDLCAVTAEMGLRPRSMPTVLIPWGSYGWTRSARPSSPYLTTEPGGADSHTHEATPRGFEPGDTVLCLFLWDDRHPIVQEVVEVQGL